MFGGQWDVFLMTLSPVAAIAPAAVSVQPQVLTFTGTGGANQPPAQTVNVTAGRRFAAQHGAADLTR
jgi:hypothetical protein